MVAQISAVSGQTVSAIEIIDIRRDLVEHSLLDDIFSGISSSKGHEKRLPTLLLYDEAGLKLFEEITYLDQYYLTNAEIDVLNAHAHAIADQIEPGSMVIELGSGNLRKVNILLRALERVQKSVEYYALDLSLSELERTLSAIPKGTYEYVKCFGLHGTYEDGLHWLGQSFNRPKPKCILSLGSSIGNFDREAAAKFLRSFAYNLHDNDRMIIGLDACKDPERVLHAYNDRDGVTHRFILNGLLHANRLIGLDVFNLHHWKVIGEWNEDAGRHQAFYSPLEDVTVNGCTVKAGERIRVEESHKYSMAESDRLWDTAGLAKSATHGNECNDYHLHVLARPSVSFPLRQDEYAASPVPTLTDWKALWVAWDTVTTIMIPKDELLSKPIKLRNACIFYLGHIPTFLDMHLSSATRQPSTEPAYYKKIFERGIDPDVNNPDECHSHSEIPDIWPPLEEILDFQDRVRNRLTAFYDMGEAHTNCKLGRSIWLGFEHELMHLETLLYMLLQSDKILSPPGPRPNFQDMARQASLQAIANQWVTIPENELTLGMDDPEDQFGPDHYFGWDNEKPPRRVKVHSFVAMARPISNEDYAHFLDETCNSSIPMSWSGDSVAHERPEAKDRTNRALNGHGPQLNGGSARLSNAYLRGKSVKTVYGLIPLEHALDWPVMASYDELAACAQWMNGRIPTMEEVRSIYSYVDRMKIEEAEKVLGKTISAVNGHLVNEGVEESPPQHPPRRVVSTGIGRSASHQLFANLEGCNIGFQNWHPTPVTQNGDKLSGQGDFGGAWEWTSSVLEKHDGFRPMDSYPGYTADFFDGKHNIVLGGSWATHPRLAGRKTFVNWYQRNYPYAWAGARLVRDA